MVLKRRQVGALQGGAWNPERLAPRTSRRVCDSEALYTGIIDWSDGGSCSRLRSVRVWTAHAGVDDDVPSGANVCDGNEVHA